MTVFDPTWSSSSPPIDRADRGHRAGGHPEQQHGGLRDPVHGDAEYRAEREHPAQPVAEHRAGQQVIDDVAVAAPLGDDVRPQLAIGAEHAGHRRRPGGDIRLSVRLRDDVGRRRRGDQHRQREDRHPRRGHQHRRAHVLPLGGRDVQQPACRPVAGDEPGVHHEQQHHAADIACSPTESGHPAGRLGCRQLPQHRVVRNTGQVAARRRECEQRQAGHQVARVGADQAHPRGQQHQRRGEHAQRASSPPWNIHPHPGDRCEQRDRDTCDREGTAEPARRRGRARQAGADGLGEVDREHERDDDRVQTRRPAVPQGPREHAPGTGHGG